MPTQDSYYVAWWSSENWGERSVRYNRIEQAENWLKDKSKINPIKESAIKTFGSKQEANSYIKYGEVVR